MIIELVLLIFAIPTGFLIAWLTKSELKDGKKGFRFLAIISIALGCFFWTYGFNYIALTCIFIAVVSLISLFSRSN